MNLTEIQNTLNNYIVIPQDGRYEIQLDILHKNVGMMVSYPNQHGELDLKYFQPQPTNVTFSIPAPLSKGDQISFWSTLQCELIRDSNSSYTINFGVGAQEGDLGEVAQMSIESIRMTEAEETQFSPLGDMPSATMAIGPFWKLNLDDLKTSAAGMSIRIAQLKDQGGYAIEKDCKVFLMNRDGQLLYSFMDPSKTIKVTESTANQGKLMLCAMIKGTPLEDGSLSFQVGDPEKDAKARLVRV